MTDSELIDAAEAYDRERSRWNLRFNKAHTPARHEVFRVDEDGDPVVMAWTTGADTAINELEEMRAIAAMKAALTLIRT